MIIRIISSFVSLMLAITGVSVPSEQKCKAEFNGTFLQSWLVTDWDDNMWNNEIKYMKEAGIKYLILQDIVSFSDENTAVINYPTELSCFEGCVISGDFVGEALRHCEGTGIKVFVGLADFSHWWTLSALTTEYCAVCDKMALIEEEIYNKYYEKYKDTFYGWYFTPEINNIPQMKISMPNIIEGFNRVIDKANSLNSDMPMMLSPYYTEYLSVNSVLETLPMWQLFMNKSHLRGGDIFCPQDAIGAGWVNIDNDEKIWQMYSAAVSSTDKDIKLWANVENMTCARDFVPFYPPATVEDENKTCTLDRFVEQMNIASKHVDNIITFSYNHYYSPNQVNSVYHRTYLDYLENGKLETEHPSEVNNAEINNDILTWSKSSDNIGIAFYIVYADNKAVARIEADDELIYQANSNKTYSIIAYDGAGNASERVFFQ